MSCGKIRYLALFLALICGLVLSLPADAYRMIQNTNTGRVTQGAWVACDAAGGFAHWGSAGIPWYVNTSGQGSNKVSALDAALRAWANVDADYRPYYAGTTTAGWGTDGTNTLLWGSTGACQPSQGCIAITALVLQSGQEIIESDILFDSSYTWQLSGSSLDTQGTATHEVGHSLGIHHTELTSTPRPTMWAYDIGSAGRSLESDDRSALFCSAERYCPRGPRLFGDGWLFAGFQETYLQWRCVNGSTVDVYRNWTKHATGVPNNGNWHEFSTIHTGPQTVYWHVCPGGSTSGCSYIIEIVYQ